MTRERTRRRFLERSLQAAAAVAVSGAGRRGRGEESPTAARSAGSADSRRPLVGVQIAAHSFFDEGVDRCLDLLGETAGVNTLFVSSHSYYGAMGRPLAVMADHGVPRRDNSKRTLRRVWVRHDERLYAGTPLRHPTPDPKAEYADRDLFRELAEPARKRGMRVFVRWYQPGSGGRRFVRHWERVESVDVFGQRAKWPCWNHPDYRAWTLATLRDIFTHYPIDGLQYGAERADPLSRMMFHSEPPSCFCDHCVARGRRRGIDVEAARRGYADLYALLEEMRKGRARTPDGAAFEVLRRVLRHPEMLLWNREWYRAQEEHHEAVFRTVREVKPGAAAGRHVDHQQTSWNPVYRAMVPYGEMARTADFVKLILYHDILGPRLRSWCLEPLRKTALGDLSLEQSLALYYAVFGLDPGEQPTLEDLAEEGLSADYVRRETRRCVEGVEGRARVHSGIGIDIPRGGGWGLRPWPSDGEEVARTVRAALDAGANGIVISREYEEMTLESLRAVGRAVRGA